MIRLMFSLVLAGASAVTSTTAMGEAVNTVRTYFYNWISTGLEVEQKWRTRLSEGRMVADTK
jgi:hypothetical protein